MVDVVFALEDGTLDDDHACALSLAVRRVLPWFDEEPEAGILPLSGLAKRQWRALRRSPQPARLAPADSP